MTKNARIQNLDNYNLRNEINDIFFQKANVNQPVVATATLSISGQSIILTTTPEFTADYMLEKKGNMGRYLLRRMDRKDRERQAIGKNSNTWNPN